ncbi:MAG: ABC transporter ATP-binding protein [Planctomycetota bacterium]|jgi:ABC-2 type transport system ATP-binding protein
MADIELDSISKRFGHVTALDAISLDIERDRVGLLGPNGAGKSTMVKCLLGLVLPTSGHATVLGKDIRSSGLEIRQRVGYLPEVDCHIPGQTACEFVAYSGELCGLPSRDAIKRAHEVLDYVGIGEERYRVVDTYSTGMRQKVKLAQAIVHDPDLLFLDEPTNGLDPEGRETMLELVRDLGETHGIGLLYSSHLLGDVEAVCKKVIILREGRIVAQDAISALKEGRGERFEVRVKGDSAAFAARIAEQGLSVEEPSHGCFRIGASTVQSKSVNRTVFEAAKETRLQLRSFRPIVSTLEDVFMETLGEERAGDS